MGRKENMNKVTLSLRQKKSSKSDSKNSNNCDEDGFTCDKIMNKVACREEKRLIHTLFLIGPLLIVCSWLIMVAIHLSVTQLMQEQALQAALEIQEERQALSQQAYVLLQLFWSQMRNDVIALLAIALTVSVVIIARSKLLSFPFRFKEIKKYKQA
jgi:hypothetical protein